MGIFWGHGLMSSQVLFEASMDGTLLDHEIISLK
jgi:hypothetical protein